MWPFKSQSELFFVCVTEQHYFSRFFSRLWSVCIPLLFDTQNPGISGFSTVHAYKYQKRQAKKTKRQVKMKRRQRNDILLISHQSTHVPEKLRFGPRP